MKVVGNFNKISPEMKAMIPTFKKGETKTFQLVVGEPNRDPDPQQRIDRPIFYSTWQIPTRCTIQDWVTKEDVEIGVPEQYKKDEVLTTKVSMPGKGEPQFKFIGKFSLIGSSQADQEMYQYYCMCPYNLSNPYRDTTIDPIFCEIKVIEESKEFTSKEDSLLEAMNAAKDISLSEAEQIAAALVWPVYSDEVVLRAKLRKYASEHPIEFNKIYKDPSTKVKSEIKQALDADIISYNPVDKTMSFGQSVIATLDIRPGSNHVEAFYEHTETSPNGKAALDNIRKQLKGKIKKTEAAT